MEINQIIWNLAVALRKASVRALSNLNLDNDFNNWRVIYMQQLWYYYGCCDIFTSLLESTKSKKQPSITYDRKKLTGKLVVGIQPVVQSRKTHLSYKSFKKLKFMNLLSVLHVERAYNLKKKFSVFFSQFVAKKEVISTLLTWISSVLRKAAIVSLNLQIRVLQISTARIDG